MRATADQISPSPSGLRCGVRLEYSQDGPVRFLELLLPWHLFSDHVRIGVMRAFDALIAAEFDRDAVAEQMSFDLDL